jgi:hypothetical protein
MGTKSTKSAKPAPELRREYAVKNVFGLPAGVPVMSIRTAPDVEDFVDYFDGDKLTPPKHMSDGAIELALTEGVLVEVSKADG